MLKKDFFQLDDVAKRLVRAEVSNILRRATISPKNMGSNVFEFLYFAPEGSGQEYTFSGQRQLCPCHEQT